MILMQTTSKHLTENPRSIGETRDYFTLFLSFFILLIKSVSTVRRGVGAGGTTHNRKLVMYKLVNRAHDEELAV